MKYQQFIQNLLLQASEIAQSSFGKVNSTVKADDNNQVLTETDLKIGELIVTKIKKIFPNHSIIDEEAGVIDKTSKYIWVVDPIDGTSNFASGVPTYGIMIGLLKDSIPIAGGLALPSFDEIYFAEKGFGTYLNNKRTYVADEPTLSNTLIAYGIDGHQKNPEFTKNECNLLSNIILNIRNLRTSNSVFDTAMVLKGNYGAILNRSSKIWNNVAQQILIEEAGGIYTTFFGEQMNYIDAIKKSSDNFTFLATTSKLHNQLLQIINTHI